jgi:hypothetical protein
VHDTTSLLMFECNAAGVAAYTNIWVDRPCRLHGVRSGHVADPIMQPGPDHTSSDFWLMNLFVLFAC